jgi:hypothetical protein
VTLLSPVIAALLGAIAAALDIMAARLRRWATPPPRPILPAVRVIDIGGRRFVMADNLPHLLPLEDA